MYMRSPTARKTRHASLTLCFIGIVAYCCYHAVSGEHGIFALMSLSHSLESSSSELDMIRAERIGLEHKVALLRPDSLDLDLLDEQARSVLVYGAPDEEILLYAPSEGKEAK